MAYLNNATFPISIYELRILVGRCQNRVQGAGLKSGVPCKPSYEQVLDMCEPYSEGGHYPKEQPPVLAFEEVMSKVGWRTGLSCPYESCE
eukprot:CAMPEP_0176159746 /NCGR_PEP_ID=MMETSP0120_2-20121206/81722_1 /TAXON_ID=160619 /ORGANISM="Kryptoperidinium foliaceum, Strain CCMP 1326" /LENGTH=89 /DNA_ID=CAMNT_0017497177 /DNA_START=103 /DNA_END=369 /DNA_ORIENTATION=-